MIRSLDTPWIAAATNVEYLTATEVLVAGNRGVVVRRIPGGKLLKTWMPTDAERSMEGWARAVVCRAEDRVVVTPPRPAGLARVTAEDPIAIAAHLVVCTFAGEVVVSLDNSRFATPIACANGLVVAGGAYEKSGVWDARTGRQRHSIEDRIVAASPACKWLLLETRNDGGYDRDIELRLVSAKDLKPRWQRTVTVRSKPIAAFVDEDRVVIGDVIDDKQHRAELLDARGRTIAKLPYPKTLETIRVVGDKVFLLSDTRDVKSQRILVARTDDLRLVRDQTMKPIVALASDGKTAIMRAGAKLATYDTSDLLAVQKQPRVKKAAKQPSAKKRAPRVHHWFFGVPRSVTVAELLGAGQDVHHMLDSPLRDLCIVVQPDDQVRELRWFMFVARRRKRPYEYAPWIDTLADLAGLLVSVLHDDLSAGTVLLSAAYVDHDRTAAMRAYSFDGRTFVNGKRLRPASSELAPALVLRAHAPDEPSVHYLTTLAGTVYRYADGRTAPPKPVPRSFVDGLTTQIDRDPLW